MKIIALIPAHNEEETLPAAIAALRAQTLPPDRIEIVSDNCTDGTEAVVISEGLTFFRTQGNAHKKAGALNQALSQYVPGLDDADLVLVTDADTALAPTFVENAVTALMTADACGGVFYGEQGGGLLGLFQRNEFVRYARQLDRHNGKARVLTGTASMFPVSVIREVAEARLSGKLPGRWPGREAVPFYTLQSLTEDGEITLALKTLGKKCVSPGECSVSTEVMTSARDWWRQRTRWQTGALDDLSAYGWFSKAVRGYTARQAGMGASVVAFFTFIGYQAWALASLPFHFQPFWLAIGILFVVERQVTVRRADWRGRLLALLMLPELAYDAAQHVVWLWCTARRQLTIKADW